MQQPVTERDALGLVRPVLDAHTLGISSVSQLLADCGLRAVAADAEICEAAEHPAKLIQIMGVCGQYSLILRP